MKPDHIVSLAALQMLSGWLDLPFTFPGIPVTEETKSLNVCCMAGGH